MNNPVKIASIIDSLGTGISFSDLAHKYSQKYRITNDKYFRTVLKRALIYNSTFFRFNNVTMLWENTCSGFLYNTDMKIFPTIRDAMFSVFAKSVSSGGGYFSVDDLHSAWFPQFNNKEWENILSEDYRHWYETPKTDTDYTPDHKLRYTFAHVKGGYCFTGLYKFVELKNDKTRVYELIDDKVPICTLIQPMVVCRITWMKEYHGITDNDTPIGGGSFVDENNDAFEKFNFMVQPDGLIHGFVETKYSTGHTADIKYANSIHIENIDWSARGKDKVENVRVVFVSYNQDTSKTVIVGWYDNATVYRNRFEYNGFHTTMTCAPESAHLIPLDERTFEIPKASKDNSYGIGQSNFWYIQTFEAAKELEKSINEYINQKL